MQGKSEAEIQQRIAQEVDAGTLTTKPLVEYKPFSEMRGPQESPQLPPGMTPEQIEEYRQKQQAIQESPSITGEPRTTEYKFSPAEAGVSATGRSLGGGLTGEGAFEAPTAPAPIMPGLGLPKTRIPELAKLEEKLGGVGKAWETAQKGIKEKGVKLRAAIGEKAKTEQEALRAQADVLGEAAAISRDLEAQRIEAEQKRQIYVDQEMSKVRDAVDQMKASKIDPYRFYKHPDGSTNYPKSIAAAIAVGLGALGSTLPARYGGGVGGPNVALQIIDKAIDRDIQAQRDDIANQRAGVGLQMNLLSQMRAQFSDERQAENAARVVMLETYKMKLEEAAMKSGSEKVIANASVLIAEADQREAVLLGDMGVKAANDALKGEQIMYGAEMGRAAMQAKAAAATAKAAGPVAFPGARIKEGPYQPTKEDFKAAKPMVAAWNEAKVLLDDLIAWRSKFGQEKLNREQLAIANTKLQRLKSAMRKVDETGARLDAGEIEMMGLDFKMGDLGFVIDKLRAVRDSVKTKITSRIGVHGFELAGQPTAGARRRQ
jgi:hypothetical protein